MAELHTALSGASSAIDDLRRALPPRRAASTPSADRAAAERAQRLRQQEGRERVRMLRGLLWLGLAILLLSMHRAGWDRVFVQGWWRQW